MKFTNTLAHFTLLFLVSLFALVAAAPVALVPRDVYVPAVLYPHRGTVWKVGNHHNVTWDVSNPPAQITNSIGSIYLRKGELTDMNHTLASGFSILLGRIEVQVPDVVPGIDYSIVLFGDSGNFSPRFTITD
ncbi:hypothetical protein EW146_g2815 [Bondarzewia mesenterica]|uniref:Yeast cell wall synthesis Kre9/Knh1-like N-terminal domain-containing protein n=1 Tax=Bondarzewia mesenterica TaxID=1095465 RepID=A0A4S4M1T8_9AGAM|nr:hypothetical protein EW146_g2815 [Bondarzewia mesenterica]